jgi:hypothetical protein
MMEGDNDDESLSEDETSISEFNNARGRRRRKRRERRERIEAEKSHLLLLMEEFVFRLSFDSG